MKVFVVTGTSGVGKTKVAKLISKKKNAIYIDVNKIIKENKLRESYDRKRKCYVVDVKKLNRVLIKLIKESKENLVIDSHLSHYLDKKYVDRCYVVKCELKFLKRRLARRRYSKGKIQENLDAEIFDVCLNEARELGHNIKVINTAKGLNKLKI